MNDKPEKEIKTLPIIKKFCLSIGQLPTSYLESIVNTIFDVMKEVESLIVSKYPNLSKKLPDKIKFISSEELLVKYPNLSERERENAICKEYGAEVADLLTGFKYIGEQIGLLEQEGHPERYILGFEESYGYLCGNYVRDKDAVSACMLIVEMAAFYAKQGKSLYDVLIGIFEKYGYYKEGVANIAFPGLAGLEAMKNRMSDLRANPPKEIAGIKVAQVADYQTGVITKSDGSTLPTGLPSSNVLFYTLENGDSIVIRPSGTEPKIKFYIEVREDMPSADKYEETVVNAEAKIERILADLGVK